MIKHYHRDTATFDSHLYVDDMNYHTNARFMVILRVFLQQGTVGATSAPGGKKSKAFDPKVWNKLVAKFQADSQKFWSGKYWLVPTVPYPELQVDFRQGSHITKYQCNAFCELHIHMMPSAADAHKVVTVYNVDAVDENGFPTDSANFSGGDMSEVHTFNTGFKDGKGKKIFSQQRTLYHEVGHLLGLNHVGVTKRSTPFKDSSGNNVMCTVATQNDQGQSESNPCYKADTLADTVSVEGLGNGLTMSEGVVWQGRIPTHTSINQGNWRISRMRVPPKKI